MIPITDASPSAMSGNTVTTKYPFDQLNVGQSFWIAGNTVKEKSIRNRVSQVNAASTKRFRCLAHRKDVGNGVIETWFEVARIA